jgi:hypothetical protein
VTNLGRLPQRADDQNPVSGHQRRRPPPRALSWLSDLLGNLFPQARVRALEWARSRPLLAVAVQVAAVGVGAIVLLGRIPGTPAWDGIYAEDLGIFLRNALQHPWQLLIPYAGYMQLVPQTLGQIASMLPLPDAAAFFAITGALIASACALFIFHASTGHIQSPVLRALLAVAVVLLPVAPLEIADSGVNTPWYLMMALFWAILWRPRTRTAMVLVALLAFLTVTSNTLAVVFAPLLLLRIIALPRWREHAVTIGFTLGALAQAPYVLGFVHGNVKRAAKLGAPGLSLSFYGHRVVLPSVGWHLSWFLRDHLGVDTATALVALLLIIVFGWALITQPTPARLFVVTAIVTGFVFSMVATTVSYWVAGNPPLPGEEAGSRYTDLPILLFQAAAIVAVDWWLRGLRRRGSHARSTAAGQGAQISMRMVAAVSALAVVFAVGWISDYRYFGNRSHVYVWSTTSAQWLKACQESTTGTIHVKLGGGTSGDIPCANINR